MRHVVVYVIGPREPAAAAAISEHTSSEVEVRQWSSGREAALALSTSAPADVVLVRASCRVGAGWLERLAAAAGTDAGVASASAIDIGDATPTLGDGLLAAAGAEALPGPRPSLERPQGPCVFLRRSALELVGDADVIDQNGRVGASFAARCRRVGLRHELADVLVADPPPVGAGSARSADEDSEAAPAIARVRRTVRRVRDGLRLGIDLRMLHGRPDGTRVHALELVTALSATRACSLTLLVGANLDRAARARLATLPRVRICELGSGGPLPPEPLDLVHRPFQLSSPGDLAALAALAPRVVVTHQDLISYHQPEYFASREAWTGYRNATREALAAVDHVLFFSAHVRRDALGERLVEPERSSVVPIGIDHAAADADDTGDSGAGLPAMREPAGLLCLGADYLHKNRVFALRIADALQREHGWQGQLVLAGPPVDHGSSREDEAAFLLARPSLRAVVTTLGAVGEAEKRRLYAEAALVLYPSVHEGFGLVPFEAADHGRPCMWASGSALAEVLPGLDGGIVPWSAQQSAERAAALLADPATRRSHLEAVRAAGIQLTWARAAERLLSVYAEVCDAPPNPLAAAAREAGLLGGVSEDAMRLVGPGGLIPGDLERPLLALFSKPALARPFGAALRAGYAAMIRRSAGRQ